MNNEELKALALAAPSGPWYAPDETAHKGTVFDCDLGSLLCYEGIESEQEACVAYVAAANPAAVLGLIADNERLEPYKTAYMEWSDKTDWVQETAEVRELGKHRADVIRDRFDALKAECEGLRKDAERYRWLRDLAQSQELRYPLMGKPAWIDENIDAAMSKEASNG